MLRNVAILTSGGDAPGMNVVVSVAIKYLLALKVTPFLVMNGFKGLVNQEIKKGTIAFANQIFNLGGSKIKSARFPQFEELKYQQQAADNLKALKIDALIVVGGDGSFIGASQLEKFNIKCIGIPASIDNDILASDYSIGFDTCLNTIKDAIAKIADTAFSHHRCMIIETMGRECGDLSFYSGLATNSKIIVISHLKVKEADLIAQIKTFYDFENIIIVVSEHLYDVHKLAAQIEQETKIITRANVLGHLQRGGTVSANDAVLAVKLTIFAIEQLFFAKKSNIFVGIKNNQLITTKISNQTNISNLKTEQFAKFLKTWSLIQNIKN